jgi:hypothetical protein
VEFFLFFDHDLAHNQGQQALTARNTHRNYLHLVIGMIGLLDRQLHFFEASEAQRTE